MRKLAPRGIGTCSIDRPINPLSLKIDDDGIFSHDLAHFKHIGTNFVAFDPIGTWRKWPKVWLFWPILAVLGQKSRSFSALAYAFK